MTRSFRPALEACESRTLMAAPVIAILGAGTAPIGPLAGHVLPGGNVVSGGPGDVDTSPISHDTATASIALAWCPNAEILPVIVTDPTTSSTQNAYVDEGIRWAVREGASVINLSYASAPFPDGVVDLGLVGAIDYAGKHGVPVVFAAGNNGSDNDTAPVFPANDTLLCKNVVSVAAIDQAGNLAPFSNYGARTVTLAAPGDPVPATIDSGQTVEVPGTSFAAPAVAGELATLREMHPHQTAAHLVQDLRRLVVPTAGTVGTTIDNGALL